MNSLNIEWSPQGFDDASIVAQEAGTELLSRLEWLSIKPEVVIDMGCATGKLSQLLAHHYPNAFVLGIDFTQAMLEHAKLALKTEKNCWVCADVNTLPLAKHSVDLVFANCILPWQKNIKSLLAEWRRVLRPEGVLLLSLFGPDTLKEWRDTLNPESMPVTMDVHDLGDLLVQTGFADPVLDVNYLTLNYKNKERLKQEMLASGMCFNAPVHFFEKACADITIEMIYAHAFMPPEYGNDSQNGVTTISLESLRQQLKTK